MKQFSTRDLFTEEDFKKAIQIVAEGGGKARIRDEIVKPRMAHINRVTGQENDPDYMAYALMYVTQPGSRT